MHLQVAEELSKNEGGHALIWSKEVGNLAFEACSDLLKSLQFFPALKAFEYPGLFRNLIMGKSVRLSQSVHPRLLILDPDQATLQKADLLILGGMTDKNWPRPAPKDPWLSAAMKKELGLLMEQDQWVLDSHLFTEFLGSFPKVICTMASRTSEGPQKTSPFLKRLEIAAACEGVSLRPTLPWQQWARDLVSVQSPAPFNRPAPSPKIGARPTRLSVTDIDMLQRDPYLFYVRKILGLRPIADLQEDPKPALFGTLLHEILEAFLSQKRPPKKDEALKSLRALAHAKSAPFQDHLAARYFWKTRFEEALYWFLEEQESLDPVEKSFLECTGSLRRPLPVASSPQNFLTLSAKADRVDRKIGGTARIIDYKSGRLPTRKDIMTGNSLQLPLEALILTEGHFDGITTLLKIDSLEYWHLKSPCKRVIYDHDIETLTTQASTHLDQILQIYYQQGAPFRASFNPAADVSYAPLLRTQEWLSNIT